MNNVVFVVAMRFIQALCLLGILIGLAQVVPLATALQAEGPIHWPTICWKILAITGPIVPSSLFIFGIQSLLRHAKQLQVNAAEPWLANPEWAAKHMRLSNRGVIIAGVIATVCLVTVGLPFAIATEKRPFQIFLAVVVLFMLLLARMFWINRKWNRSELRMANVPGVIGGPFSGAVILQQTFPPETAFEVCLKCEHTHSPRSTSSKKSGQTTTTTVWSSTLYLNKTLDGEVGKTQLPFSFAIPFDCQATTSMVEGGRDNYAWKLFVNIKEDVKCSGSTFIVPVYKTPDSSPNFQIDDALIAPYLEEVSVAAVLQRLGMSRTKLADGSESITFSTWDSTVFTVLAVITPFFIAGVMACFWFIKSFPSAAFAALFPGIFVAIFVYAMIEMLFWRGKIDVKGDMLYFESGIAGFRTSGNAPRDLRTKVECCMDYRKQNGEWWCLRIQAPPMISFLDGDAMTSRFVEQGDKRRKSKEFTILPPVKVVRQLNGRIEAEAVQVWLAEQFGVSAEKPKLTVSS